jgi:putative nucleotidyltransferase with HDIG domain
MANLDDPQLSLNDLYTTFRSIMDDLSHSAVPAASIAAQDLAHATNSLQRLNNEMAIELSLCKKHLDALIGVGSALNSSLGLNAVLIKVIDAVLALTQAERGYIILRTDDGEFPVETARSMHQVDLSETDFAISKTILRRVIESGKALLTSNAQEDSRFGGQLSIVAHNLRSIMCAPLRLKKEIIGVIFVDSRVHANLFQDNDLEMLSAFAAQAAIAIDNARLFDSLQQANEELIAAYAATLEGWASALELRDRETEGHTRRVTALTVKLAEHIGLDAEDLSHIQRGALLHDIGKIGVPDRILHKSGELTDDEREIMRQHTKFAHDMLSSINYLKPALDIPYCHHEKWDGTGYPRGLKGGQIPLAARIFAVVDVWDALTTDRPYRKAWSAEKTLDYIWSCSGTHFDPQVVNAFSEMILEN